jgi:hypothetical protein
MANLLLSDAWPDSAFTSVYIFNAHHKGRVRRATMATYALLSHAVAVQSLPLLDRRPSHSRMCALRARLYSYSAPKSWNREANLWSFCNFNKLWIFSGQYICSGSLKSSQGTLSQWSIDIALTYNSYINRAWPEQHPVAILRQWHGLFTQKWCLQRQHHDVFSGNQTLLGATNIE